MQSFRNERKGTCTDSAVREKTMRTNMYTASFQEKSSRVLTAITLIRRSGACQTVWMTLDRCPHTHTHTHTNSKLKQPL